MAKFKVAAVFSSNMVIQREKNIRVFGEGEDNSKVTVLFHGNTYETVVNKERWLVTLPPMAAGTGYDMTIHCEDQIRKFENIALGEVWLAGGQSNMEYELQNCTGGQEMLKKDGNSNVRYYYSNKMAYMDDEFYELEAQTCWMEFSEENSKKWSAVGYTFARKLAQDLGVTVGIIGCNWGGTYASCWMDEESLGEDVELSTYLEYYKDTEGKTEEDQVREFKEFQIYHGEWEKKCAKLYEENPDMNWNQAQEILGTCQWPGPKGCMNPNRPGGLYKTMLKRLAPYTIRGFLYYQGEEDDKKPHLYQKLLTRLIKLWRADWEDQRLPFLLVQLPMHRYKENPDDKSWCLLREAQMNTYETVKNTGIAVILDCGEFNEIHPKDKKPVGERLELQAMHHVYGKINAEEAFGPIYRSFVYQEGGMELSFDYAQDGFIVQGEPGGFEIAGEDLEYKPAMFELRHAKIFVYSKEVPDPVAVRYCWTNYGEVPIFGKNGLPLAPFRSDYQQKSCLPNNHQLRIYHGSLDETTS